MRRGAGSAVVAAAIGCVLLVALGVWQLYRLQWKEALVADVNARLSASAVPLGEAITHPMEFLRVKTTGRFQNEREMFLLASEVGSAGWRVVTPFASDEGIMVLVDRGFVPDDERDPTKRPQSDPPGDVAIEGYISRHSSGQGLFTPDNDPARDNWYWWDIPAMLAFAKIDPASRVAPFILHVLPSVGAADALPKPTPPALNLTNNHLQYALTWFALAIVLAAVTFAFVRGERPRPSDPHQ
jgi:surfeit locus 1 family protein